MALVCRFGRMELSTKATGETTWLMATVASGMLTVISMMGSGNSIELTAMVYTHMSMARSMKVIGPTIAKMVMVKRPGPMDQSLLVNTKTV